MKLAIAILFLQKVQTVYGELALKASQDVQASNIFSGHCSFANMSAKKPNKSALDALSLATRLQSASALSFFAFLALHLAAPLSAAFKLDASTTMLLTREYYQTSLLEPILVWGSLAVHVTSSITRRAFQGPPKKSSSLHSIAGFLLVPCVIGHALTHRILPARRGISPSLLSYQFVSYSLLVHPYTSWLGYGLLSVAASYHAAGGLKMILSGRRRAARLPDGNIAKVGYAAVVSGLGLGLFNLAKNGTEVPLWLCKRYAEVLQASRLY